MKTACVPTTTLHTHVSPEAPGVTVHVSAQPEAGVGKPPAQRTRNQFCCVSAKRVDLPPGCLTATRPLEFT